MPSTFPIYPGHAVPLDLRALGINDEPQMRRADEAVLSPGHYRRSPVSSVAWQSQHRGRWRSVDATALAVHAQKAPRQRRTSCWAGFGRNCRRLAGPALSSLVSRLSGRAAAGGAAAARPPVGPEGAASCGSRSSKRGRSGRRIHGGCRRSPFASKVVLRCRSVGHRDPCSSAAVGTPGQPDGNAACTVARTRPYS